MPVLSVALASLEEAPRSAARLRRAASGQAELTLVIGSALRQSARDLREASGQKNQSV